MPKPENESVAFKGRMMTLTVLEVRDSDIEAIDASVQQQVQRSPGFFARMPVLLSLQVAGVDLQALCELLAAADLVVVGVLDATAADAAAAQAAGLGLLSSPAAQVRRDKNTSRRPVNGNARTEDARTTDKARSKQEAEAAANMRRSPTRLITRPVRSGQQVYARGGDLVITSSVSEGAEVLADGHIHIYGALRGRALAGASGDTQARIFCRQFEPDLVAVAGCYKVADAIAENVRGACVQVSLDHDSLLIELQE
ncbi:MAG TPA: septum site-determining protein MinC [Salinisphaeraceae bacterium]|nr:septum site-determining protein MinC [Salinisphaeraceae bacterium]